MPAQNPEARAWLSSNANGSALATNKFWKTARALAFVDELYAAGRLTTTVLPSRRRRLL